MKIKEQLVSDRSKTYSGTNPCDYITIHETANTHRGADAQAHANLQANGFSASWHIQVDDKQAIRSFPDTVRCWHAGDARGDGNMSSIGIEICVNRDGDYDKALANAAEVVKQLRKEHGISRSHVVQHNHWSGKNCPTQLRASGKWDQFVASTDPDGSTPAPKTGGGSSGGSNSKSVGTLASEVIDGKHGSGEARKRALGSQYSAVQAEVNRRLGASSSSSGGRKSVGALAQEVIDGKHGSGDARKRSLGSRYSAVQAEVNRRLGAGPSSGGGRKSTATLVQEVIDGKHGSGDARKRSLGSRYSEVQNAVNKRLGAGGSSGGGKSISQLADEVERGVHGNGDARKRSLGSRYSAVQAEINRRYS